MAKSAVSVNAAKEVCKRIYYITENVINANAQLHFTLQKMHRVDDVNTFSKHVITTLEQSVAAFRTARMVAKIFYGSLLSKGLNKKKWSDFCVFWNRVSSYLSDQKDIAVRSVMELIRKEILHVWHFRGMITLSKAYRPHQRILTEGTEQYGRMILLWNCMRYVTCYTTTCYLFLEVKPHLLNPWLFFIVADAFYYFVYRFFECIARKASIDNLYLYDMAFTFLDLGIMCPILKLEFPNPQQVVHAAQRLSKEPLSPNAIDKLKLLSMLKIVPQRFHSSSIKIAERFARNEAFECLREHYVLQLAGAVLEDAIRKVKSVYKEMRRIVCYILLQIFPRVELRDKIHIFLKNNMHIYFYDCIDLLKICKQIIDAIRTYTPGNSDITAQATLIYREVYLPNKTLSTTLPDIIKDGLIEFARSHYNDTRDALTRDTAIYIIHFAQACANKGCNPVMYKQVMTYYLRAIVMFKDMYSELEDAINDCGDGMLIALEGTTRDNKSTLLQCFRTAYAKFPEMKGKYVDHKMILRKLPLNARLRKAIVAEMGPTFDGTEADIDPRYSIPKIHFPRKDIDLKFYVPPQEDILTKEQLDEYFK